MADAVGLVQVQQGELAGSFTAYRLAEAALMYVQAQHVHGLLAQRVAARLLVPIVDDAHADEAAHRRCQRFTAGVAKKGQGVADGGPAGRTQATQGGGQGQLQLLVDRADAVEKEVAELKIHQAWDCGNPKFLLGCTACIPLQSTPSVAQRSRIPGPGSPSNRDIS
jgi:hypothetical protein